MCKTPSKWFHPLLFHQQHFIALFLRMHQEPEKGLTVLPFTLPMKWPFIFKIKNNTVLAWKHGIRILVLEPKHRCGSWIQEAASTRYILKAWEVTWEVNASFIGRFFDTETIRIISVMRHWLISPVLAISPHQRVDWTHSGVQDTMRELSFQRFPSKELLDGATHSRE